MLDLLFDIASTCHYNQRVLSAGLNRGRFFTYPVATENKVVERSIGMGNRHVKTVVSLLMITALASATFATEKPDNTALAHYLALAAQNNPSLEAAFNQWKAALEGATVAGALPDPRFNYGYFIESVETRVGPQRQKFGLSQAFPWFGTLKLKRGAALEQAAAMEAAYRRRQADLFRQVKEVYADLYHLGRALAVTREHIALLTQFEQTVRTRYTTGKAPHSALINVQIELDRLQERLQSQQTLRQPLNARFNELLGQNADTPLPWPSSPGLLDLPLTEDELETQMLQHNPQLQQLEAQSRREEKRVQIARRQYLPDLMLGVDYIDTGEAAMPDTPDSGKDPVIAMASVNLPIWFHKNSARIREAELNRLGLELEQRDTGAKLLADLQLALYAWHDAVRQARLYHESLIPKADQSLQVTLQEFETGSATFDDVISAQRALLEFELQYETAQTKQAKQVARIEQLINRGRYETEEI
jgi:outer membrane protein TolC